MAMEMEIYTPRLGSAPIVACRYVLYNTNRLSLALPLHPGSSEASKRLNKDSWLAG